MAHISPSGATDRKKAKKRHLTEGMTENWHRHHVVVDNYVLVKYGVRVLEI
jgi:hypothetical protein